MSEPSRIAELQARWRMLLAEEETAFELACTLDREDDRPTPAKAEAVRTWWSIVNSILWLQIRTKAQFGHELEPPAVITLGRLANISEEISNGNIPHFVTDASEVGRNKYWIRERHHISYGILYIEAVRQGEISDNAPNKTVREAFGVSAKTVQNWLKKRDEICVGVPKSNLSGDELLQKVYDCGAIYSRIGRGATKHD